MPVPEPEVGPIPSGRDPAEYDRLRRRVLWSMPSGLFVVGSRHGDRRNLMTANWVMQIATAPKLVAVGLETASVTRGLVEAGGAFSVSILGTSARTVVRRFVKPVRDVELDATGAVVAAGGQPVREVTGGLPCLASALAWIACEVRRTLEWEREGGGPASHVLVVGEVVDAGEWGEGAPGGPSEVLDMSDTRMNYGG